MKRRPPDHELVTKVRWIAARPDWHSFLGSQILWSSRRKMESLGFRERDGWEHVKVYIERKRAPKRRKAVRK